MNVLKRLFVAALVVVALAFVIMQTAGRQVGHALFARAASRAVGRDVTVSLPDGLHVALCGAGSPMFDPTRAGPCVAVLAGDRLFVIDTGTESPRKLMPMGLPPGKIEAILLTHFHSDHIDGLGEMMLQRWIGGTHTEPVPVYGPEGVEEVVDGFNAAYRLDSGYRLAHHGATIAPLSGAGGAARSFAVKEGGTTVLEDGDLEITAFRVDHHPVEPSVGYRFDYKGRSAVISGDTAPSESLVAASKDADVIFHEALDPELVGVMGEEGKRKGLRVVETIAHDIPDYHTTPEQAAEAAAAANAGLLVLYHIVPPLPLPVLYPAFLGDAPSRFDGPIHVGEDGLMISLPAGSEAVDVSKLL